MLQLAPFFPSFIIKQLQDTVHINIQIKAYTQTMIYVMFYSNKFVAMVCIFIFLLQVSICFWNSKYLTIALYVEFLSNHVQSYFPNDRI